MQRLHQICELLLQILLEKMAHQIQFAQTKQESIVFTQYFLRKQRSGEEKQRKFIILICCHEIYISSHDCFQKQVSVIICLFDGFSVQHSPNNTIFLSVVLSNQHNQNETILSCTVKRKKIFVRSRIECINLKEITCQKEKLHTSGLSHATISP